MRVIADEDFPLHIVERMRLLLGSNVRVDRVVEIEGWSGTPNGHLAPMALNEGYTHMVSCDKAMADKEYAVMPVLLIDKVRVDELSRAEAVAGAIAEVLATNPPAEPGYTGVPAPGHVTSIKLQRIIDGKHWTHPNQKEQYDHWQRARRAGARD